MNPKYAVKVELKQLLEAGFIRPVENTKWVFPVTSASKKIGKLWVCINDEKVNDVTKKYRYSISFYAKILDEVGGHDLYLFVNGYRYHQKKIAPEDQFKTIFTSPWSTFYYEVMSFKLCNAATTF
jgi:hypothetical protein